MAGTLRLFNAVLLSAAFLFVPAAFAADPAAAPPFPELTGPVVDGAGILDADTRQLLTDRLTAYDQGSGNQLVVVTVQTLDGYPIEYWGYQLGRHWGIGQAGKNTGALLIVDVAERKLRIEAGYGLEGTLTDALSDDIIRNTIAPKFKQGDYSGGVTDGVDAILKVLGGQADAVRHQRHKDNGSTLFLVIFLVFILLRVIMAGMRPGRSGSGFWWWLWVLSSLGNSGRGAGWGGGGGGGGGFSGGGGSFGGGGASGSW
ncbi:MAG TPA: TPM domain-containing protein [Gammaproteobacteria bacterium]|nr:TPM domain-containing protein [Gammaproteobacteria bacterium]